VTKVTKEHKSLSYFAFVLYTLERQPKRR